MTDETIATQHEHMKKVVVRQGGGSGSVYSLGMIGAWIFFMKGATTNKERLEGFLKGLVWPAILVHELFVFLKKDQPAKTD